MRLIKVYTAISNVAWMEVSSARHERVTSPSNWVVELLRDVTSLMLRLMTPLRGTTLKIAEVYSMRQADGLAIRSVGYSVTGVLALVVLPFALQAQEGFDDELSFNEIFQRLDKANNAQDVREQGLMWYKWANYEWKTYGNRALMFDYLTKSAARFYRIGDSLAYFRVRAELAELLPEKSSADEALLIQKEALDYFRRHGHLRLEARLLVSLARIYHIKNDSTTANVYKKAFREKNDALRDTLLETRLHIDEVQRFQREKKYNAALYLAYRVRANADSIHRADLSAWAEYQIGYLNFLNGETDIALKSLTKAEKYDLRLYDTLARNICRDLAYIYGKKDSLKQAYYYAMKCISLSEDLLQREREATYQRLALFIVVRDYRHRLRTNRVIAEQTEKINQQTIRQLEDTFRIESMQSMIEGQESERRRVAHDLHDSLGGLLAATKMRLENLTGKVPGLSANEEFAKIKGLLDDTIAETRQISRNLQPGSLHQFGLMKAIRDLIGRVQGEGVPTISFQHYGDFTDLDHTKALNCYRIVQELLQNSLKHAKATEFLVQLGRTDIVLTLLVEDNGTGYDPNRVVKGMGTDNVSQRVQFVQGVISIQTAAGQGTSTMITVPLP